jgi:Protein of unknown function (DUF3119)
MLTNHSYHDRLLMSHSISLCLTRQCLNNNFGTMQVMVHLLFFLGLCNGLRCSISRYNNPSIHRVRAIDNSMESVAIVPPNSNVALGFLGLSGVLGYLHAPWLLSLPIFLLTAIITFKTGKINFVFDEEAFEIMSSNGYNGKLEISADNVIVGGRNRWKYSSVVNWFFIPSDKFPVLLYFRETQTKPDGQAHLFPVIVVCMNFVHYLFWLTCLVIN